jgi:hypothetical protein
MANILSLNNLIDEETGRTNRDVLRGLVHRRAMAEYGAITPRSLREAHLLRLPPGPASDGLAHTARRSSSDDRNHSLWRGT